MASSPRRLGGPGDPEAWFPAEAVTTCSPGSSRVSAANAPAHLERPGRLLGLELQQRRRARARAPDQTGGHEITAVHAAPRRSDVLGRRKHAPTVRPVRVLTLGETMVLLDGVEGGLAARRAVPAPAGGAESNFGDRSGAARRARDLGLPSRHRPVRDSCTTPWPAKGLDLRFVGRDPGAPTESSSSGTRVGRAVSSTGVPVRRRAGCARDVPPEAFDGGGLVHLTGITMALSGSARCGRARRCRRGPGTRASR